MVSEKAYDSEVWEMSLESIDALSLEICKRLWEASKHGGEQEELAVHSCLDEIRKRYPRATIDERFWGDLMRQGIGLFRDGSIKLTQSE